MIYVTICISVGENSCKITSNTDTYLATPAKQHNTYIIDLTSDLLSFLKGQVL